jgi:tetratricopeptide (TPR) repeat protein
MRRALWLGMCAFALAACERHAPTDNAAICNDVQAAPADRVAACTVVIEAGDLDLAGRAAMQAHRGAAHRAAGEVTPALRDFEAVLRQDAGNSEALEGRAAILLASGQLDAAAPLVERLIATGERLDQAELMKGDIALAHGEYDAAIAAYDSALARNGRLALALAHRGRAKQHLDDHAGALADYEAAISMDRTLVDPRSGRCWLSLIQEQNLDRARTDAETAVAADPRNVEAQLCRGILQLQGQEWDNARSSFNAVLVVEPGNPIALFGRGVARRRGGDGEGTRDMNRARDFDHHIGEKFDEFGVATY